MSKIRGYKIIKTLGRGGMATVYLAVQKSVDRYVALKVMAPELVTEESFSARFLAEARIAARFRHPNIVAIHDVNVEKGLPYIAMEYVPGGSLDEERLADMSLLHKLKMLAQIADALGFLHKKKNYIHRDVKPDNVIFREDGTAVLTDFGIARDESSDLSMTKTGSVIGTPYYMSPEQARGKKLDSRSDLYSLGVMLYRVLTGEVPFDAEDALSIYIMHAREVVPDLPAEFALLDPVVKRLMEKLPEDRYPDSNTLILDLARIAETSPSQLLNHSFEGVALEITGETDADDEERDQEPGQDSQPAKGAVSDQTEVLANSDAKSRAPVDVAVPSPGSSEEPGAGLKAEATGSGDPSPRSEWQQRLELIQEKSRTAWELIQEKSRSAWELIVTRIGRGPAIGLIVALLILLLVLILPRSGDPDLDSVDGMLTRALAIAGSQDQQQRLEAEALFNQVLERDPGNSAAIAGLEAIFALNNHYTPTGGGTEANDAIVHNTVQGTEQVVQRLLSEGNTALAEGRLTKPGQDNAYAKFRAALELAPSNNQAQQGLQAVADQLAWKVGVALDAGDLGQVASGLADARSIGQGATTAYRELYTRYESLLASQGNNRTDVAGLLARGNAHLEADRLLKPADDNAVSSFRTVLQLDANNPQARSGLDRVAGRYLQLATQAVDRADQRQARIYLEHATDIAPGLAGLGELELRLQSLQTPAVNSVAVDTSIGLTALPQAVFDEGESASVLFRRAEANLKTNDQLMAYALYHQVLVLNPKHKAARRRLYLGAGQYLRLASRDIGNNELDSARKRLSLATAIDPAHPELAAAQRAYRTRLESRDSTAAAPVEQDTLAHMRLKLLLSTAETARQRYASDPANHQAAEDAGRNYQEVLRVAPGHRQARAGLDALGTSLLEAGQAAASRKQFDEANWCLQQAKVVIAGHPGIDLLATAINNE